MANVAIDHVQAALDTGAAGGTQTIEIAGFGQPKAAVFLISGGNADDNITPDAIVGVGFTDGTREVCVASRAEDGATTTNTGRTHRSDSCIAIPTASAGLEGRFGFNAWTSNGVTLDIDDDVADDYFITAIFINGDDVGSVYANFHDDLGNSAATTTNITAPGFEPNLLFLATAGLNSTVNNNAIHFLHTFGMAINDGVTVDQKVTMMGSNDGQGSSPQTTNYVGNAEALGQAISSSSQWQAVVEDFDSSGFSVNPDAGAGNDLFFYLAIELNNSPDIALFDMQWPTSGSYAETNPNFGASPTFGMIVGNQGPTSYNAARASTNGGMSFMTFNGTTLYTISVTDEDGAATSVCKSLHSDQARILDYDGSSNALLATFDGFDNDGWDFSITTHPGNAIYGWGFAIRDTGGGGGPTGGILPGSLGLMGMGI